MPKLKLLTEITSLDLDTAIEHVINSDMRNGFELDRTQGLNPRTDLKGRNLRSLTLKPGSDWRRANLRSANLKAASLVRVILFEADLSDANLSGANLRYANLNRANLEGANLEGADLSGANFSFTHLEAAKSKGPTFFAFFTKVDLSGANLNGANLKSANLSGATFNKASLIAADLNGANLKNADFRGVVGVTLDQIKAAQNWQQACYDSDFREQLGLPPEPF